MEALKPVNSNSCESKATELTLVKSSKFPIIPSVKIVVTKGTETHEFLSFKAYEAWAIDECDSKLYEAYQWADSDETRGCEFKQWIHNCVNSDELTEYVEAQGWEMKRVTE